MCHKITKRRTNKVVHFMTKKGSLLLRQLWSQIFGDFILDFVDNFSIRAITVGLCCVYKNGLVVTLRVLKSMHLNKLTSGRFRFRLRSAMIAGMLWEWSKGSVFGTVACTEIAERRMLLWSTSAKPAKCESPYDATADRVWSALAGSAHVQLNGHFLKCQQNELVSLVSICQWSTLLVSRFSTVGTLDKE